MPLIITRPSITEAQVAQNLENKAQSFVNDCAELARGALQSYTPNRWKKLLYKAVSVVDNIPGGKGVGGPVGQGGLLPHPLPVAPKGTIAAFLMAHPEYAVRNRDYDSVAPSYMPKGKSFPKAWQHLEREAKELLRDERLAGMYGGMPPHVPYWIIAEEGMERVGIPAINYIKNSRVAVEQAVPIIEARTLKTL